MPTYNPPNHYMHPKLTPFQLSCSHHSNTPSFNLTLPTNLSHYELIWSLLSGIPNVIFHQDIQL